MRLDHLLSKRKVKKSDIVALRSLSTRDKHVCSYLNFGFLLFRLFVFGLVAQPVRALL